MEKNFATYEISKKLKELGFVEPCLGRYIDERLEIEKATNLPSVSYVCLAPLWQQVIDWFRTEHDIEITVYKFYFNDSKRNVYTYSITELEKSEYPYVHYLADEMTYEQARTLAVNHAIDILNVRLKYDVNQTKS